MPECGKCHTKLPEPETVRLLRRLYAIPRTVWIAILAIPDRLSDLVGTGADNVKDGTTESQDRFGCGDQASSVSAISIARPTWTSDQKMRLF
jgi:hypothetical protein